MANKLAMVKVQTIKSLEAASLSERQIAVTLLVTRNAVRWHPGRGASKERKGYCEAVRRLITESFIRSVENAFWAVGGAPKMVVFDNGKPR